MIKILQEKKGLENNFEENYASQIIIFKHRLHDRGLLEFPVI
jgi:hypothetical protein